MIRQCLICKSDFITYPSRVNNRTGLYCSADCRIKSTIGKPSKLRGRPRFDMRGDKNPTQTPEARKKNKLAIKEYYKTHSSWNKGGHQTKEWTEKIKKANLGKKRSLESRKKMSIVHVGLQAGPKHPCWKGGLSLLPYTTDWTHSLRISIRERDKYTCKVCGSKQGDKIFHVHHIDYKKENCNPNNLITLCPTCHMKTNYRRDYWLNYFKLNLCLS